MMETVLTASAIAACLSVSICAITAALRLTDIYNALCDLVETAERLNRGKIIIPVREAPRKTAA